MTTDSATMKAFTTPPCHSKPKKKVSSYKQKITERMLGRKINMARSCIPEVLGLFPDFCHNFSPSE